MLEESDSDLIGFFDEIYKIIIPLNWASNLQEDAKKKVVVILYLIAGFHNMHANQFKLELGLYLAACRVSCETINTLSNTEISVINKTVYNNKKKITLQHLSKVEEYFIEN
ncbi:5336_t:CDS:1, partial [Dentiscutata erythropus]